MMGLLRELCLAVDDEGLLFRWWWGVVGSGGAVAAEAGGGGGGGVALLEVVVVVVRMRCHLGLKDCRKGKQEMIIGDERVMRAVE